MRGDEGDHYRVLGNRWKKVEVEVRGVFFSFLMLG